MTDVNTYSYELTLTPLGGLEVNKTPVEVPPEHRAGRQPLFWAMAEVNQQHLACGGELSLTVYDELTGGGKLIIGAHPGETVDLEGLLPAGPRIRAQERVRLPLPAMEEPGRAPEPAAEDTEPIPRVPVQQPSPEPAPPVARPTLRTPPPPPAPSAPAPARAAAAPSPQVPAKVSPQAEWGGSKPPSPVNAFFQPSTRVVTTPRGLEPRPVAASARTAAPSSPAPRPSAPRDPARDAAAGREPAPLRSAAGPPAAPADAPVRSVARAESRPAATAVATQAAPTREIVVRRRTPSQVATREAPAPAPVRFAWERTDLVLSAPVIPPPLLADRPAPPRRITIPRRALVAAGALAVLGAAGAGWVAFGQQGPPSHSAVCVEATSMTRVAADGGCEFPRRWWYVPPRQPIARVGQVVGVQGAFDLPSGDGARAETLKDDQPAS